MHDDRERKRLDGTARSGEDRLPTYQELLDQSVEMSFPASDPPAISAGSHPLRPISTRRDRRDWTLAPQRK